VRPTFLIASNESIPILQELPDLHEARAFRDDDALHVIQALEGHDQPLVVIEKHFAATTRGQAFIDLLTMELKGSGGEFRIVGVRRAARHKLRERVFLDGGPATVLDISTMGAHIVASSPVKPHQRVRVSLREGDRALTGTAVWVQLELPREGPRYSAGIEFVPTAAATLAEYISEITR
jgi:PilZ domain